MNPISPVHWSAQNGLHTDHCVPLNDGGYMKCHQPVYPGQTTLNTFTNPSYLNDQQMFQLNNPGAYAPMLPYQR